MSQIEKLEAIADRDHMEDRCLKASRYFLNQVRDSKGNVVTVGNSITISN